MRSAEKLPGRETSSPARDRTSAAGNRAGSPSSDGDSAAAGPAASHSPISSAVDLGNRPYLVYNVEHSSSGPMVRDFNIHLFKEFYQAFANEAGANLHVKVQYGFEPHHLAEGCMKAFARAISAATRIDPRVGDAVMSTKGSLNV